MLMHFNCKTTLVYLSALISVHALLLIKQASKKFISSFQESFSSCPTHTTESFDCLLISFMSVIYS